MLDLQPRTCAIRQATLADLGDVNSWAGIDLSPFLANPLNVCLLRDNGGAMFTWRGPGIYEVHVFFEQRGKEALTVGRQMLAILRSDYGARLFWSPIPISERHVVLYARLMGWRFCGTGLFPNGETMLPCEIYSSGF